MHARGQFRPGAPGKRLSALSIRALQYDQCVAALHAALHLGLHHHIFIDGLRWLRSGSGRGFRCCRRLLCGGWLSRARRCALRSCRRCGRICVLLLCVCPGCFHRVFRRQEGLQSACRRRLQAEPPEHSEVRLVQFGAFTVFNDKAPALFLDVYPYRIHTVKHAPDPPLDRRALHAVREAALDLLNIRVLGAVPFYDPLFAVLKIDRNAA